MKRLANRQNIIIYLFILSAVVLIFRAAQLQIFDSSYRDQAERTTLDKNTRYPARGLVYDRTKKLLVANSPIYDIEAIYNNVSSKMDTSLFCNLLEISKEDFENRLNKNWSDPRYSKSNRFIFLNKIDPNIFAKFREHLYNFPGFYPVIRNIRYYPHNAGAHALGYLSEVNYKNIDLNPEEYKSGDLIGASGLEKKYEDELKGHKGFEYILKDNLGRDVGRFNEGRLDSFATEGEDIQLSLDLDLQAYGEKLMQNKKGAIIALEPSSGEILAMVSAPSFDPNSLSFSKDRGEAFTKLANDTINKPLYNRAVNAKYPPGSIFKPIFSLIALHHGTTWANRTIRCNGIFKLSRNSKDVQKCHSHTTPYNITMAIQHSCNVYYYTLMREFVDQYSYDSPGRGIDTLMNYLSKFGLGSKLGVDFTYENDGSIPYSSYYDELYRITAPNGWKSSYITSLGIGQGEFEFTTIQMANLAASIANRGYYYTPHFIKSFISSNKEIPKRFKEKKYTGIDQEHFIPVINGMEKAVTSGTAGGAHSRDYVVCGKTGTSQNPHGEDHSVFIAFAPKDNPKIAIAVYVENAGWGNSYGAPIAGLMIEKYLKGEISAYKKWQEERMFEADLLNRDKL